MIEQKNNSLSICNKYSGHAFKANIMKKRKEKIHDLIIPRRIY